MALDLKEVQKRMDIVYRRYRNKDLTNNQLLLIAQFRDDLYDDLSLSNQKMGKNKKGRSKDVDKQVKMIEALKMNNPLWDIE